MSCRLAVLLLLPLVVSCGPMGQLQHIDMASQNPEEVAASMNVQVFEGGEAHPVVSKAVGVVDATSCKNKTWDPPATKGDALRQLRLKALRMGANAVINVYFDTRGTDTWGTNCWESVSASGDAVLLKP